MPPVLRAAEKQEIAKQFARFPCPAIRALEIRLPIADLAPHRGRESPSAAQSPDDMRTVAAIALRPLGEVDMGTNRLIREKWNFPGPRIRGRSASNQIGNSAADDRRWSNSRTALYIAVMGLGALVLLTSRAPVSPVLVYSLLSISDSFLLFFCSLYAIYFAARSLSRTKGAFPFVWLKSFAANAFREFFLSGWVAASALIVSAVYWHQAWIRPYFYFWSSATLLYLGFRAAVVTSDVTSLNPNSSKWLQELAFRQLPSNLMAAAPLLALLAAVSFQSEWIPLARTAAWAELFWLSIYWLTKKSQTIADILTACSFVALIVLAAAGLDDSVVPEIVTAWMGWDTGKSQLLGSMINTINLPIAGATLAILSTRVSEILRAILKRRSFASPQELARLEEPVAVHDDLRPRRKVLLLGTFMPGPLTNPPTIRLLEIWIATSPTALQYQFDLAELLHIVNTRMTADTPCDVIVTRSFNNPTDERARRFVAYASADELIQLLLDPVGGAALAQAFQQRDPDAVADAIGRRPTISTNGSKHRALQLMCAASADRILILDHTERFVGFCNLQKTAAEIFRS